MFDPRLTLCEIGSAHGKTTHTNMKKTLLIAAAALAASVISSQAQVYSQNVVGYANVVQSGGSDLLLSVPFKMGVSNGINEVFGSSLPSGSQILTWNGVGYNTALYDPTDPNGVGAGAPVWYLADDATPLTPLPTLAVGQGFHLIAPASVTNTFVGTVAVNVGTSNVTSLAGSTYLVGSVVPYAGVVTNGNSSGGGLNLNGLPISTRLLIWTGSGYSTALYDPTDPNGVGAGAPLWYREDDATPYVNPTLGGNVPSVTVGQGVFLITPSTYNWTVGL